MGKKRLVICMDGTWQNLAWQAMETDITGLPLDRRTNVSKIAQLTKQHADDGTPQIVFYSPGVGAREFVTRDKKKMKYEGATGDGAEEAMIAAYMFLCFNYEVGDDIMLFGFSRGAFCVRSLGGLIARCGILKRDLTAQVRNALELYRRDPEDPSNTNLAAEFRAKYSVSTKIAGNDGVAVDDPEAIRVNYIGVFDTVVMRASSFLGLLEGESKEFRFHDLKLGRHVLAARHAMAIDENRNALPLKMWSNLQARNRERGADPASPNAPFQQKWFVGAHGDVGGGQSRELSEVSRKWVMRGALAAGLEITEPLALEGGPQAPLFYKGEIEKIRTLRFPLGQQDRKIYPDPLDAGDPVPDPEDLDTACDRCIHVTSAMRVIERARERNNRYRPRPLLRPFRQVFDQSNAQKLQAWIEQRSSDLFS